MAKTVQSTPEFQRAFSLFRPSMKALRVNLYTLFYMCVNPFVLLVAGAFFFVTVHSGVLRDFFYAVGGIVVTASVVWALVSWTALPFLELASVRGKQINIGDTIHFSRQRGMRMLGAYLLTNIIILLGLIAFIFPGFYFMQRYLQVPYLVADYDIGIREAMKRSAELGKKYKGPLWGVVGVQSFFRIIEFIPFAGALLGGMFSLLYLCAPAIRYEEVAKAEARQTKKHGGKK